MPKIEAPHNHLEMMKNPDKWPLFVLPIKNKSTREIGILLGGKPIIYKTNMFNVPDNWNDVPQAYYSSYEAIIADGWIVD